MTRSEWRRQVDHIALEHGCAVEITKRSHLRLRHPAGWTVITAGSPGDKRAFRNLRAELRRQARKAELRRHARRAA